MSDQNYDVIVPAATVKWIGLVGGLLLPLFFAVVAAQIYGGSGTQDVQVYPLPEE